MVRAHRVVHELAHLLLVEGFVDRVGHVHPMANRCQVMGLVHRGLLYDFPRSRLDGRWFVVLRYLCLIYKL